jgi:hypothetical protein
MNLFTNNVPSYISRDLLLIHTKYKGDWIYNYEILKNHYDDGQSLLQDSESSKNGGSH